MKSSMRLDYLRVALTLMVAGTSLHAYAQPNEPIFSLAKKEKPALLESLKAWCRSRPAVATSKASASSPTLSPDD